MTRTSGSCEFLASLFTSSLPTAPSPHTAKEGCGIPTSKHTLPRALEKLVGLAGVHRIKIHALRHSHASLLISMGENPLLIKERLGHEKIQTTLGTYGHLYPNTNVEVAKKLTGVLTYTPATTSVADYTSNQHTAIYHRTVE